MSIEQAFATATEAVLNDYLAADLVDKLTGEIVRRARPELQAALAEFVGFEVAVRPEARAKAPPQGKKTKAGRPKATGARATAPSSANDTPPQTGSKVADSNQAVAPDGGAEVPEVAPKPAAQAVSS